MTAQPVRFVILSSSRGTNALGRALALAAVAREWADAEVWAYNDGDEWVGTAQWPDSVQPFTRSATVVRRIADLARTAQVVVWSSKSFPPLARILDDAARIDGALVVADFDDDDVGLIDEYRAMSVANRLRLNAIRRTGRRRVRVAQARAVRVADAITVASNAVAATLGRPPHPRARIVHARSSHPPRPEGSGLPTRVAFMGTIRAHKGIEYLCDVVAADPSLRGVTYAQAGWQVPLELRSRWTELAPDTPLVDAYREIDVALVPSRVTSSAAQAQVPAKVIDAIAAGVPLLATPTRAVVEILGDAFIPVSDWSAPSVLALLGDRERLVSVSARANDLFVREFTLAANARILRTLIEPLLDRSER